MKIKPFINKYNQEGINYLLVKDKWKKHERSNMKIAEKEKIYPACVSNMT